MDQPPGIGIFADLPAAFRTVTTQAAAVTVAAPPNASHLRDRDRDGNIGDLVIGDWVIG